MLITYFDEVKFQPGKQPFYWLGGITVDSQEILKLEKNLNELAIECFNSEICLSETEFHAADLFNRKNHFKNWKDPLKRFAIISKIINIIDNSENIAKILVRLEPAKISKPDYEEMAFMFFVEKVESYLASKKITGILIGDRENDTVSNKFSEILSGYRKNGTPYDFGKDINFLIDTVHFTSSHHSRMLQLADTYVWLQQLAHTGDRTNLAVKYVLDSCSKTNINFPTKYKFWPPK